MSTLLIFWSCKWSLSVNSKTDHKGLSTTSSASATKRVLSNGSSTDGGEDSKDSKLSIRTRKDSTTDRRTNPKLYLFI
ncbi:hypothetical protein C4D60_Mb03t15380 [Musa balbisiana]|uniref:Uncharacterized protein n=1 Tax=Musa balbisiana TaxID=52838 RepID=A0A4V4H644_MUSBA|nr:hypothetical protein C4D60_Mb03t15380 [Musa balbisiana]